MKVTLASKSRKAHLSNFRGMPAFARHDGEFPERVPGVWSDAAVGYVAPCGAAVRRKVDAARVQRFVEQPALMSALEPGHRANTICSFRPSVLLRNCGRTPRALLLCRSPGNAGGEKKKLFLMANIPREIFLNLGKGAGGDACRAGG